MDRKELKRKLMATFKVELEEHLATLNKGLLALEEGLPQKEKESLIPELFRAAHSLKGAARAVDLRDIEAMAHRMEDVMSAIREDGLSPTPDLFDALYSTIDKIQEAMVAHLKGEHLPDEQIDQLLRQLHAILNGNDLPSPPLIPDHEPKPEIETETAIQETAGPFPEPSEPETESSPPTPDQPPRAVTSEETIRVATTKLDALMDGMGELLVARMATEQRLKELQTILPKISNWQKSWRQVRPQYSFFRRKNNIDQNTLSLLDFLTGNEEHLKTIGEELSNMATTFASDYGRFSLLIDDLQEGVRRVRMLPISTLFDQFPRMVRDLAHEQDKEITLHIEGGEAEVDRHVLETMKDPLTHLLRNAAGHGIEPPEQREAAGKSAEGTIHLRAAQKGNTIVLEVADDGAGIDLKKVRQSAVKQGLLTKDQAPDLSEQETIDFIFRSGLSTQDQATGLAGRGVGLDVVRQNLEELQGLIQVKTTPKKGTTFTLILPLTLATNQVLLVEIDGETMAIPTTSVERIQRVETNQVGSIEGKPAIRIAGRALPLIPLAHAIDLKDSEAALESDKIIPVVVLGSAERRLAFRVDGFQGTQEVVVKTMGHQLSRIKNVAGVTILGSGRVVMILNVADMLKSVRLGPSVTIRPQDKEKEVTRHRVLVVDDSITTRTLEKNILENAGYHVIVAADGEEAWTLVESESLDAIVADIHMPRMDGFEFTEKVKGDERYQELPVILVTSLDSREHKIRGLKAGANAYITKQTFDQQELLETIERLIG